VVVPAQALAEHVQGFVDAPERFEPVLRAVSEQVTAWPRIVQVVDEPAGGGVEVASVRRVGACDGAALGADVAARGRRPSWTMSPDNLASLGVARGLGFRHVRDDVLYLVGVPVPS
jgi:hypothetical protein